MGTTGVRLDYVTWKRSMLKYPLGCQIESEEIYLHKFWHMGDVIRSKGGRQHLGMPYKKKFPFLWNMPRKMDVFLFKLVPGVQYFLVFRRAEEGENLHLLQVGKCVKAKRALCTGAQPPWLRPS